MLAFPTAEFFIRGISYCGFFTRKRWLSSKRCQSEGSRNIPTYNPPLRGHSPSQAGTDPQAGAGLPQKRTCQEGPGWCSGARAGSGQEVLRLDRRGRWGLMWDMSGRPISRWKLSSSASVPLLQCIKIQSGLGSGYFPSYKGWLGA